MFYNGNGDLSGDIPAIPTWGGTGVDEDDPPTIVCSPTGKVRPIGRWAVVRRSETAGAQGYKGAKERGLEIVAAQGGLEEILMRLRV